MITRSIKKNPASGRYYIVTRDDRSDGSWSYVRRAGGGLTLSTQSLDYYFVGMQDKGYKTEEYARKVMEAMT